jgi:acyl-CoA synthetase (AMP-forming)/AMP-acid ligase II
MEVRVVAEGKQVTTGEPGEIVVRGYTVMSGYWGNPGATAEAIDTDGWLHTGDIGVMDAQGNVTITDRLKDMYVVGGFNAYPAEIEAILRGHEAVAQAAVVGVPDERMGEVGCAYVVPVVGALSGDSEDEADELGRTILSWSRGAMANYKVPRGVVLVDSLPVNASGKVLKRELRGRHATGADRVVTIERSK